MAESRKRKIVIVEDEGLIAADLEARLKAAGYAVPGIADSGVQALDLIRQNSPDLILMDIRIKGDLDGIQVAHRVREQFDIPVVYLTAYEDQGTLDRASQTQAFGYIRKPLASASLQGSIEMAIAKHRHEHELRQQRDWAVASFAAVPEAVLVTDSLGRVCYLNALAENLTGWSVEQALGQPSPCLLRLFQEESGEAIEDLVPVAMLQGEPVALPPRLLLRDHHGQSHAIEGEIAPRWRDGHVEGAVASFRDTTAGRFEQEHAQRDSKQDALVRFAESVAQELPELSAAAEKATHLVRSLPPGEAARRDAEAIEHATVDAFAVACRLRALVQPPQVSLQRVSLKDLLAELENPGKLIVPSLRVLPDLDPRPVQADARELTRAILNILIHARGRMKGETELVVDSLAPAAEGLQGWVRIRIAYQSSGEDAAALERALEPSVSGDAGGLHASYVLVRKMGGLLTAGVHQRGDVRFEIYLPQVKSAAAGAALPEAPPRAILAVEGNSAVRRVLRTYFEQQGYNVLAAANCEEALLLAELFQGTIPLAIASCKDSAGAPSSFIERLQAIQPGILVRPMAGYAEPDEHGVDGSSQRSILRHLTKWDLLALAQAAQDSTQILTSGM